MTGPDGLAWKLSVRIRPNLADVPSILTFCRQTLALKFFSVRVFRMSLAWAIPQLPTILSGCWYAPFWCCSCRQGLPVLRPDWSAPRTRSTSRSRTSPTSASPALPSGPSVSASCSARRRVVSSARPISFSIAGPLTARAVRGSWPSSSFSSPSAARRRPSCPVPLRNA